MTPTPLEHFNPFSLFRPLMLNLQSKQESDFLICKMMGGQLWG